MCGGIVGALSFGVPEQVRGRPGRFLPYLLAYNGGRLASYAFAGALMGGVGLLASNLVALHEAQRVLLIVAGLFMLALGLYLGGWWGGLARIERAGGKVWRYVEPFGRKFVPVRSPGRALALGLVWGWLPCGLVYTSLIWTLSAGGPVQGALLMLSFGLGTLPNLLAMGLVATRLARFTRLVWVRHTAGTLVLLFGVMTLARAFL
jgi:sulfite exporter TauE/SafE